VETQTPSPELLAQVPKAPTVEASRPLKPVIANAERETDLTKLHRKAAAALRTDAGAARLFRDILGNIVRYDHSRRRWLVWDDHRWKPDDDAGVNRVAFDLAALVRQAAGNDYLALEDDERKKLFGWGLDLDKRRGHEALLALARTLQPITDSGRGWDAATGIVGAPNGVIDLRTGELRDGHPDDRITKQVAIDYDPKAECPRWEAFVREVVEDAETVAYLQRLAGYSLTGEASEDKLVFLMGHGGNGKTTLLNFLRRIAGDYAQEVGAAALLDDRASAHTTEVADLEGSRLATCEEIGDAKLNTNRLKQISGGSPITARRMKQDTRTFDPTWQLWITTNGLPRANDNARAFWRRVVAIDFPNDFDPTDEPDLEDKLAAELPGILAWIVRGAVAYYENGLGSLPAAVAAHTAAYRQDSDPLQPVFEAGYLVEDETAWTPSALLHGAYLRWADTAQVPAAFRLGTKGFSQALSGRFNSKRQAQDGTTARGFLGVRVGEAK
jgi:P4 family phage/plasmid primase-like protien